MQFSLRRFIKNLGYLFSVNIFSSFVLFFQGIILVRYLGSENYGMWSLARSLPGMLFMLTDLGLNSLILREIAQQPSRERIEHFLGNTLYIKSILSVSFLFILSLILLLFDYPLKVAILVLLSAVSFICISFAEVIIVVFKAMENFKWQAGYTFLQTAGIFILVVVNVVLESDILVILICIALFQLILLGSYLAYASKYYRIRLSNLIPFHQQMQLIKRALPFAIIVVASGFFKEIDTVMLSKLAQFSDVGIFNAANRLITALMMFPLFFGHVIFPSFSYLYKNNFQEYFKLVLQFEKYIMIALIPLCLIFYRLAGPVILILFGEEYTSAIRPLQILSFALLLYFLSVPFIQALNAGHQEKKLAIIITIATLAKIPANFLFIPIYTATGAGMAAVLGEFVRSAGVMAIFFINFPVQYRPKSLAQGFITFLPLTAFLFSFTGIGGYFIYFFSLIGYIGLLFKSPLLSRSEVNGIRQKLFPRRSMVSAEEPLK